MTDQVKLEYGTIKILDESVLDVYNESIKSYKEKARNSLNNFSRGNGILIGSSPLGVIKLVNAGLLPKGTRLATREDLEYAIRKDNSFLIGNDVNFALALRTSRDFYTPNDLLAERLAEQLEQRGLSLGTGKLIPLDVLSLTEDEDSHYGLVINLKEDISKSLIRNLNDYKWDYTRTRGDGLSCACLGWDSDWLWDSGDEFLAYSDAGGRVVVVSNEATL